MMSKSHNWRFPFLLLCSALAPSFAIAAPLNLKDTIRYAIENSPTLDTAKRTAILSTLSLKNAKSAFLPTLDLSANLGHRGYSPDYTNLYQAPNTPAPNNVTSGLSLTLAENLYDNNLSIDTYRLTKLREEQANVQALETRDRFFLQVASSYYAYSLSSTTLKIQEEQFKSVKLQYEQVDQGYHQGLRTRKDYLRFKTQLSRSDIDLRVARNALLLAKQDLQRLIGVPSNAQEGLDFALADGTPNLAPLANLDVNKHRQSRISDLENRAQAITTLIEKRKNWPQLFATANVNYGASDFVNSGVPFGRQDTLSYAAAVTLNYNILDWGIRRRNVESAEINQAIVANQQRDTLLQIGTEINKLQINYKQYVDNYRLSQELLDLEDKNLASITREYRQGKVYYLDYITSLQNFSSAQSGLYSAMINLKQAQLQYRYNQGTLYEAIFE